MLDQSIPARLPLLDAYVADYLPAGYRLGADAAVLLQHQLGSIVPMTRTLLELGLDPARVYWVDIPYTANATVAWALQELGIPEANFARTGDYDLTMRYAPYQHRRVTQLVAELRETLADGERLLVLDDGSYFAEAASCFAALPFRVALVEQTRRGMIKLRHNGAAHAFAAGVPFVNVAESRAKLDVEPRFIGDSVVRGIRTALGGRDLSARRALLLGYGAIGRPIGEVLVDEFGLAREDFHVGDIAAEPLERAREHGFATWDRSAPPPGGYDVVIGCSGTTSFGVGDRLHLADGAQLISASSGAAELSREEFIELADAHEHDDIRVLNPDLARENLHATIHLQFVDREVSFLNGGFPVNFDGQVNCVAARDIQLTRALMVAAAVQALEADGPGLHPFDEAVGDWLTQRFDEVRA
ncbi:hypothetical protein OJ997_25485 [Solirubrobacter phytolaccae]|uniref:Adenosylhomocysteinase n=1 Tax=Solirubrobacter phytolaccae TaxID=1404360 RepID=A0A9X3NLI3_9ACTN|nr:hypothetical protein [Solirubrobacter phytolaccae]MDA0183687.1 hypothetical protein [Solirubrobacter phytolaccae]